MFGNYTLDPFKGREMDYTVKLELLNHGSSGAAAVSGIITGLSLSTVGTPLVGKDAQPLANTASNAVVLISLLMDLIMLSSPEIFISPRSAPIWRRPCLL